MSTRGRLVGSGSDVLAIRSTEVIDGRVTLHKYAAYTP